MGMLLSYQQHIGKIWFSTIEALPPLVPCSTWPSALTVGDLWFTVFLAMVSFLPRKLVCYSLIWVKPCTSWSSSSSHSISANSRTSGFTSWLSPAFSHSSDFSSCHSFPTQLATNGSNGACLTWPSSSHSLFSWAGVLVRISPSYSIVQVLNRAFSHLKCSRNHQTYRCLLPNSDRLLRRQHGRCASLPHQWRTTVPNRHDCLLCVFRAGDCGDYLVGSVVRVGEQAER